MLEHWCANLDLLIILDHHAAINYIVKYATKQERTGWKEQHFTASDQDDYQNG
jgi:hypothetical protein